MRARMLAGLNIVHGSTSTILIVTVVASVVVGLVVAQLGGSTENIQPTRSGLGCFQNPGCPTLPKTLSVFHPNADLGLAAGVVTLVSFVAAWRVTRKRSHVREVTDRP
jgi:hypothetical protein